MEKKVRLRMKQYLDEHKISRYALSKATKIGFPTIDRYYKNQIVRYDSDVLGRIITVLNCNIEDIFEIYEEDPDTSK